jgi:hypothetical protein
MNNLLEGVILTQEIDCVAWLLEEKKDTTTSLYQEVMFPRMKIDG